MRQAPYLHYIAWNVQFYYIFCRSWKKRLYKYWIIVQCMVFTQITLRSYLHSCYRWFLSMSYYIILTNSTRQSQMYKLLHIELNNLIKIILLCSQCCKWKINSSSGWFLLIISLNFYLINFKIFLNLLFSCWFKWIEQFYQTSDSS